MSAKGFLIAPVALLAFVAQSPETLTPEGPATLYSDWHGAMTLEGEHPELLTGFRVVVQPGGRAGTIRFLVHESPAVRRGRPADGPRRPAGDAAGRAGHVHLPRTACLRRLPQRHVRDRAGDGRPRHHGPDPLLARGRRGRRLQLAVRRRLPPAAGRRDPRPPHRERRPARPRADDRADHGARRRPRRRRRRDRGPHEPARLRDHAAPERAPARVRHHGRERRAAHRRPPAGAGVLPSEPGPRRLDPGLRRRAAPVLLGRPGRRPAAAVLHAGAAGRRRAANRAARRPGPGVRRCVLLALRRGPRPGGRRSGRGPRGPWPAAAAVAGGGRPPGIHRQRHPHHRALDPQGPRAPAGATRQPNLHAHDHVAPRGQARRDAPAPAAAGPRERAS